MPRGAFFSTVCAFLSLAKGFALRISARRALRAWLAAGGTVCDLPDISRAAAAAGNLDLVVALTNKMDQYFRQTSGRCSRLCSLVAQKK